MWLREPLRLRAIRPDDRRSKLRLRERRRRRPLTKPIAAGGRFSCACVHPLGVTGRRCLSAWPSLPAPGQPQVPEKRRIGEADHANRWVARASRTCERPTRQSRLMRRLELQENPQLRRRPRTGRRRSISIDRSGVVVAVIRVIGISAMVASVIGHRVSDRSAPDPANDRANRTANDRAGHRPPDRAGDQTVFVGKGNLRRGETQQHS